MRSEVALVILVPRGIFKVLYWISSDAPVLASAVLSPCPYVRAFALDYRVMNSNPSLSPGFLMSGVSGPEWGADSITHTITEMSHIIMKYISHYRIDDRLPLGYTPILNNLSLALELIWHLPNAYGSSLASKNVAIICRVPRSAHMILALEALVLDRYIKDRARGLRGDPPNCEELRTRPGLPPATFPSLWCRGLLLRRDQGVRLEDQWWRRDVKGILLGALTSRVKGIDSGAFAFPLASGGCRCVNLLGRLVIPLLGWVSILLSFNPRLIFLLAFIISKKEDVCPWRCEQYAPVRVPWKIWIC
ncbi:hypothetical protein CRG98_011340 [Punica granatum]|uniref:Uncharacterized protein n=1 Tax=Punica granatum TaxID=22663 RepID=A0A2I0KIV9_PUNGR|nr:hypothetical protein CRG98_011340 [Punica granatum]